MIRFSHLIHKVLLLLSFLFTATSAAFSQSTMTDSEIIRFAKEQYERGVSQQEILSQLKQKGVTTEQLNQIKTKVERGEIKLQEEATNHIPSSMISRTRTSNGGVRSMESTTVVADDQDTDDISFLFDFKKDATKTKKRIFGHDVFNKKNLTFESSMNLPTPQNYVLGPGDVVNIDIWGASQISSSKVLSPDGKIVIEGVGVIDLGGQTIANASKHLKEMLGARFQSSEIELTLGQTRTITVSVMGEVQMPGTYTLSAFASVFHALYMAGGPNDIGTLRSVKVYRAGKLVSTIDIYDYLLNGKLTGDIHLKDNDVITVSPYAMLVSVSGKVKRPMYYEMKADETANTLLHYAGGFTGDAFTKAVRIYRKTGTYLSVFNIGEFDLARFKLMDGDQLQIDSTLNRYQNMVKIEGAVFRPGMYQLGGDISSIKSLIEAASGLKEDAISHQAVIHRLKDDRTRKAISANIAAILEGIDPDIPLENEDIIYVASREKLNKERTVTIKGEVYNPGTYYYVEDETLENLIIQAGGMTEGATLSKIDVARRISNISADKVTDTLTTVYSFNVNAERLVDSPHPFVLQPHDQVFVRRNPNYVTEQQISVEGEILFEGKYALTSKEQRLSEAIKMAGGLTKHAYLEGAKLLRQMTDDERAVAETMIRTAYRNTGKDSIDVSKLMRNASYPLAIELDKALKNPYTDDDPILREGDRIVIPKFTSSVTINGEVLYPNTIRFKEGLSAKDYVKLAGGYTSSAKKGKTIIIYMNGMVAKANCKNKPRPGCQILVPTKKRKASLSTPEILSIISSTASVGTMAATVANLLKK